jgi:transcriptional regulator with XRE-family HTH domain
MTADFPKQISTPHKAFGRHLRQHRVARRLSQLQFGLLAEVSPRHVCFLENGRARPSREMVIRLVRVLELSAASRDVLLVSAGLAPEGDAVDRVDALTRAIEIQQAPSIAAALDLTQASLAALGLRHFYIGVMTPSPSTPPSIAFGDMRHAPIRWMTHYGERSFRPRDPFIRATAAAQRPFFWSDVVGERRPVTPFERQMLGEAAAFGITAGFVLPVRLADGRVQALSSMGSDVASGDPSLRWEARLLATAALERLMDLAA